MDKIMIRQVDVDDLDELLKIDQDYCRRYGTEAIVNLSSLNFYSRSGHSFASLVEGRLNGFVFSHAVWGGYKAVLQVTRLAASDDNEPVQSALLEALLKSAYDAAVYELRVTQPNNDEKGLATLMKKDFKLTNTKLLQRTLGSGKFGV